jgi:hypothetical protein
MSTGPAYPQDGIVLGGSLQPHRAVPAYVKPCTSAHSCRWLLHLIPSRFSIGQKLTDSSAEVATRPFFYRCTTLIRYAFDLKDGKDTIRPSLQGMRSAQRIILLVADFSDALEMYAEYLRFVGLPRCDHP